jgi:hypothetical protein
MPNMSVPPILIDGQGQKERAAKKYVGGKRLF